MARWDVPGVQGFAVPQADGQLDIQRVLETCAAQGLTSVYCEGGGQLAASLLRADLVDDLVVYHAGCVIGATGLSGVADLGITALADAPRWALYAQHSIGADIKTHWLRA